MPQPNPPQTQNSPSPTSPPPAPSRDPLDGRLLVVRLRSERGDAKRDIPASHDTFALPSRKFPGDAGLDLTVAHFTSIPSGATVKVRHNLAVALPKGTYGLIVPRSSTLPNKRLIVLPGVIDGGFRGEVQTVVYNPSQFAVQLQPGERISQLLVFRSFAFEVVDASEVDEKGVEVGIANLPKSDRGEDGFGSTGGIIIKGEKPSAT